VDAGTFRQPILLPGASQVTATPLSASTDAQLKQLMQAVVTSGTAASIGFGPGVYAKTGTADIQGQEQPNSWLIAFDPAKDVAVACLVVNAGYGSAGQADDNVSLVHACTLGGAVRFDRHDQHAAVFGESVCPCQPAQHAHVLAGDTDPATSDAPIGDESPGNELGRIDRDGEGQVVWLIPPGVQVQEVLGHPGGSAAAPDVVSKARLSARRYPACPYGSGRAGDPVREDVRRDQEVDLHAVFRRSFEDFNERECRGGELAVGSDKRAWPAQRSEAEHPRAPPPARTQHRRPPLSEQDGGKRYGSPCRSALHSVVRHGGPDATIRHKSPSLSVVSFAPAVLSLRHNERTRPSRPLQT